MTAQRHVDRTTRTADRRDAAPDAVRARTGPAETFHDAATRPTDVPQATGGRQDPPRTTTFGWLTAPKFGAAGSGGAELEPGPERD